MRLVTQPVIPSGSEEKENVVELQEDQRFDSEEISLNDSDSSTPSRFVRPVQIQQSLQVFSSNKTPKPKNNPVKDTPPVMGSKPICSEQRIKRGMALLETILKDIIEAVKVTALITPLDATEAAAVGKRETEFSARFRRLSYQLRRTIAALKNVRLRLKLKGQICGDGVLQNMLQVLAALRLLLTTYLRYIPLSGGRVFPAVVEESLPILKQAVVLAKEFEVDCSAVENLLGRLKMLLLQNVKQEEAHFEAESKCENHLSGNQNASKLFEQLARNTFGPPLGATSQQSSKLIKSKFSSTPSPKSRSTKTPQARTNMARSRRMSADQLAKSDSNMSRSPTRSNSSSAVQQVLSIPVPQSSRSSPRESRTQKDTETSSGSMEIGCVLSRLHNLELLATRQSSDSPLSAQLGNPTHLEKTSTKTEKVLDGQKVNIQDLGMMLTRTQIIKSDFDVVAQKHQSTPVLIQGLDVQPRHTEDPNCIFQPERGPTGTQTKEMEWDDESMEPLCFQTLQDIVNRVSEEILEADFAYCATVN